MTSSPRIDSLSIEDIENLYHVKPNGKDYDMLDIAHPNSCYFSDAHDKLNGRIPNQREQNSEIIGKITHPTNGLLEQTIYAQASLMDEVIKIGFQMERESVEDLTDLADCCASQMYKATLSKSAFLPAIPVAVWLAAGGVTTVLTTLGLVNNFGPSIDKGVINNAARAGEDLQAVNEDYPKLVSQVVTMIKNISFVKDLGDQAMHSNLTAETATKESIEAATALLEKYKKATQLLSQYIPTYISLLSAEQPDDDSGDFMTVLKKVYHTIAPTSIKTAISALQTLQDSLAKSGEAITAYEHGLQSFLEQNKNAIEDMIAKQTEDSKLPTHAPVKDNSPKSLTDITSLINSK